MHTKLNSINFTMFGINRLIFNGETPSALTEAQLQSSAAPERTEALTLNDEDSPAEANADHPKVKEYSDKVKAKLQTTIKEAGIKSVEDANTIKINLDQQKSALDGFKNSVAGGDAVLSDAEKSTYKANETVSNFPSLLTAIEAEGATENSIRAAIDAELPRIDAELTNAATELLVAKETNKSAEQVTNQLQLVAIDTIKEKQTFRFEVAKTDFQIEKISQIFPDANAENYVNNCALASNFMDGLLSNAEFTHDPAKFEEAFKACMSKTNDDAIKQYVENLNKGEEKNNEVNAETKSIFGTNSAEVPANVKAYVHGLLASRKGQDQYVGWVAQRLQGLNPMDLNTVTRALSGYHVDGITDFESTVGEKYADTLEQVNMSPEVQLIYRERMAEAKKFFGKDAQGSDVLYRNYFLAQVNQMGTADINKIKSIPSPSMFANHADTMDTLPSGAKSAINVSKEAVDIAQRLASKCRETNAFTGQVFTFTEGENIYYAVYEGGSNVTIHEMKNGPNMNATMPEVNAPSGDRTVMATADTGEVRKQPSTPTGGTETASDNLTGEDGVKKYNEQLNSRIAGLKNEVKTGEIKDVDTVRIHLDTALRAAAGGIEDVRTKVQVEGYPFNIVIPKGAAMMVSGDMRAVAEVIFNGNQPKKDAEKPAEAKNLDANRSAVRSLISSAVSQTEQFLNNHERTRSASSIASIIRGNLRNANVDPAVRDALKGTNSFGTSAQIDGMSFGIYYNPTLDNFDVRVATNRQRTGERMSTM